MNRRQACLAVGRAAAGAAVVLLGVGCRRGGKEGAAAGKETAATGPGAGESDVSPAEDLMREHGLLRRVMMVYEEAGRRATAGGAVPVEAVRQAAGIVNAFVHGYHEKLEEEHIFPRFEKAGGAMGELVRTLRQQHAAGRLVTGEVVRLAEPEAMKELGGRGRLAGAMGQFVRMYRVHAAREDTVLFPAMHGAWTEKEYDEMGDAFEKKEEEMFGEGGFEKMVEKVAEIERRLGIYDLSQFTPRG